MKWSFTEVREVDQNKNMLTIIWRIGQLGLVVADERKNWIKWLKNDSNWPNQMMEACLTQPHHTYI